MLTDLDDDFFYEEDKIHADTVKMPLLQLVDSDGDCGGSSNKSSNNETSKQKLLTKQQIAAQKEKLPLATCDGILEIKVDASYAVEGFGAETTATAEAAATVEAAATAAAEGETRQTQTAAVTADGIDATIICPFYMTAQDDNDEVVINAGRFNDTNIQKFELDRLGMTVTTKTALIIKDNGNLIGISIGGGAPLCPCLYIVQVFDGTPAAVDGSLESGDELLAVNNASVKGKTKVEVAKMIQSAPTEVRIHFNKLHADPKQGKSLDIIFKKLKHRIVDSMSSNAADTLGFSRAILCNDTLVKRLEQLEGTEFMYKGLVEHARRMLKAHYDLLQVYRSFGDCFTEISAHEPQQRASEAFRTFGEFHRALERDGLEILKNIKPILDDFGTYLHKAIPDTKQTVRRYADAKFTYLSYCLKVKEMDDEEHGFASIQEPLYRVETGNYEYRLILRCRQDARAKFAKLRTDVLEKMELLEAKHATDLNQQLYKFLKCLEHLNKKIVERINDLPQLFPIEVDFKETDFQYKSNILKPQEPDDDDEQEEEQQGACGGVNLVDCKEVCLGDEAIEQPAACVNVIPSTSKKVQKNKESNKLIPELDLKENSGTETTAKAKSKEKEDRNETLLKELGLFGIDLNSTPQTFSNQTDSMSTQKDTFDFDLFLNQTASTTTELERDLMLSNALETDLLLQ